jgi:hypothetical protein
MARHDEAAIAFPTSKRERWTEARARAVLDACDRSGLTLSAFARQRGTGPQRLAWWRKRLAETSRGTSPSPVSLVPVTLRLAPAIALGVPVVPNARLMGPEAGVFASLMGPPDRQGHGATRPGG